MNKENYENEFEKNDAHNSVAKIIKNMQRIRQHNLLSHKANDKEKQNYLCLSQSLASAIENFKDDLLAKKIQEVYVESDKNSELMKYDALQERNWRIKEPVFSKALDDILVAFRKEDFIWIDEKHHIFNALKCLKAKEKSLQERICMYDSILPAHASLDKSSWAKHRKRIYKYAESIRDPDYISNKRRLLKGYKFFEEVSALVYFENAKYLITYNPRENEKSRGRQMDRDVHDPTYSFKDIRGFNIKQKLIPSPLGLHSAYETDEGIIIGSVGAIVSLYTKSGKSLLEGRHSIQKVRNRIFVTTGASVTEVVLFEKVDGSELLENQLAPCETFGCPD